MALTPINAGRVHWVRRGPRHGTPVIFIHGAGGNGLLWGPVVAALKPALSTVVVDLPGHGGSDGPGLVSVSAYAESCATLLTEIGACPAVIVGHSMGGGVALALALAHPDLARALVLVDSGARLRVAPAVLEGLDTDYEAAVGVFAAFACGPHLPVSATQSCENALRRTGKSTLAGDLAACNEFDVRADLGKIRVPTLVICGEDDALTPLKYARYLADAIEGATLLTVPTAGHMVMLESPAAVAQAIGTFVGGLDRHDGSGARPGRLRAVVRKD